MSGIMMTYPNFVFLDKTKGSLKNRAQCAGEHFANGLKSSAAIIGSAATGSFIADCVISSANPTMGAGIVNEFFEDALKEGFKDAKGLKKVAQGVKLGLYNVEKACIEFFKKPSCQRFIGKADNFINEITNGGLERLGKEFTKKGIKTAAAIVFVSTVAVGFAVLLNNFYKRGQIDQKYTDKAQHEQPQVTFKKPQYPVSYGLGI